MQWRMLSAEMKEEIKGTAEIRETFKISKLVLSQVVFTEGTIERNHDVRVIRDGVVVYTGKLGSLKASRTMRKFAKVSNVV